MDSTLPEPCLYHLTAWHMEAYRNKGQNPKQTQLLSNQAQSDNAVGEENSVPTSQEAKRQKVGGVSTDAADTESTAPRDGRSVTGGKRRVSDIRSTFRYCSWIDKPEGNWVGSVLSSRRVN